MFDDPNWPRASAWLAGNLEAQASLGVLGVPLSDSITPGRCDLAPAAVRQALARYSTYDIAHDVDLTGLDAHDFGDLELSSLSSLEAYAPILEGVADALFHSQALVVLGGDNGLTRAAVHGLRKPFERVGLVTLDAHFDLRDTASGLHNGNPIRALLEDGFPGENIVQIGLQPFANSGTYARLAKDAGIKVVTVDEVLSTGPTCVLARAFQDLHRKVDAIYFDLDLDVMDRAFAPGCPGSRPGGLTPSQVRECAYVAGHHPKVMVMDLVELDPEKDINDCTALAAAACLLSFASGLSKRLPE